MTDKMSKGYYVHCNQHGAVHVAETDGSCWCGCVEDSPSREHGMFATVLETPLGEDPVPECVRRGLWLSRYEGRPLKADEHD